MLRIIVFALGFFYFCIGLYGQFFAAPAEVDSAAQAGHEHYIAIGLLAMLYAVRSL